MLDHDPNFLGHAKKLFLEMLDKGIDQALWGTYVAVFIGIACLESLEKSEELLIEEDGTKVLEVMMAKGSYLTPRL